MGNPSILGRPVPYTPPEPRWTPREHNGILGWIADDSAARELLPAPDGLPRGTKHQVTMPHPEVGAVCITYEVKRAAGRFKGVPPFWCAVFAERVAAPAQRS